VLEPAEHGDELIRSLLADVTAAFEAIVVSLQIEQAHGEPEFALDEARRRVARLRARLAETDQRPTGT
jgi:hypothetical protein